MQLCQGPLEKLVKNRQFYGNIESDKEVLLQVIQGVKWLSDNKVAYRSLNPFNILVSFAKGETQPRIKLGDFFISRMQKSDKNVITNSGNNRNPNWSRDTEREVIHASGRCVFMWISFCLFPF